MAACADCNRTLKSSNPRAKYCSDTCRARASKQRSRGEAPEGSEVATPQQDAVRVALEAAGRFDTWLGQNAMALAKRIDAGASTMAADSKQLQVTMAAALQGMSGARSAMDELRARRDQKRGA